MRLKTRLKKSDAEVNVITSPDPVLDQAVEVPPPAEAQAEAASEAEAAEILRHQMESLKRAESHQREAAQQQPQQPTLEQLRAERLNQWKSQGLPEADARFMESHPAMIDYPALTQIAVNQVIQSGHVPGGEGFHSAVAAAFDGHMAQMQRMAKPVAAAGESAGDASGAPSRTLETPVTAALEVPAMSDPSDRSSIVSAPVSRNAPSASYSGIAQDPSQVRLSPEEVAVAKASGISLTEYARNKLRLQREVAEGHRQR